MQEVLWFITSSFQMLLVHPIVGVAIVGIAYTWVLTYQEVREAKVLAWPQRIAVLSVLAATLQAPLPFLMAFFSFFESAERARQTGRDVPDPRLGWLAGLEVVFFLVSLPCALKRKGRARWCLALSSIVLLAFTGFIYIVSQIRF